jgi:hypothetical protein
MAFFINISNIPDDLPSGGYDASLDNMRFVKCRDGKTELLFELSFRGPRNAADPSLIYFEKKGAADGEGNPTQAQVQESKAQGQERE